MNTVMPTIHVGRDESCEIPIADESVSRRHAQLEITADGRLKVTDCGSVNGTFVIEEGGIRSFSEAVLEPGQTVRFGSCDLPVHDLIEIIRRRKCEPASEAEPTPREPNPQPISTPEKTRKPRVLSMVVFFAVVAVLALVFFFSNGNGSKGGPEGDDPRPGQSAQPNPDQQNSTPTAEPPRNVALPESAPNPPQTKKPGADDRDYLPPMQKGEPQPDPTPVAPTPAPTPASSTDPGAGSPAQPTSGGSGANGAGIWTDPETGMTWQVSPTGAGVVLDGEEIKGMEWPIAIKHCAALNLAGFSDWRLPTISEFRTLIRNCENTKTGGPCLVSDSCLSKERCSSNICACRGEGYPENWPRDDVLRGIYWPPELVIENWWYWTASEVDGDADLRAWDIQGGTTWIDVSLKVGWNMVRCVR
jgi:Protein of unknown function (DUF1566)/FHA domain